MSHPFNPCAIKTTILLLWHFISYTQSTVFEEGENGYQCFRIPAVVKAPNGNLLAFAEARKNNCSDHGNVDIVLKTSSDAGTTWSALQVVIDLEAKQVGNPAPVFDLLDAKFPNGRLFLFYNTGTDSEQAVREGKAVREVWFKTSIDDGRTWSESENITKFVSKPNKPNLSPAYHFKEDWRSYANTPGHAIQLQIGKNKGKIFVPANHSAGPPQTDFLDYQAHSFYTPNHGKTWQLTPNVPVLSSNEATAVELPNGKILMNSRLQSGKPRLRILSELELGSKKWTNVRLKDDLQDPVCEGSMLNFVHPKTKQRFILFSNLNHQEKRQNLCLKQSFDNGKTWQLVKIICPSSSAYSDLVAINDATVGILYERDDYKRIVFEVVRF